MAVITDYTGRSVDLFIMQGAKPEGERLITTGLGGDTGGMITTGIQKAAQTFLILFLTEKGSRQHDLDFGTRFIETIRSSNMDDGQLQIAFRDAAEDILDQQILYLASDALDDEVLTEIELLSISSPSLDQVKLIVKLTTASGDTRDVIVPVTLAIK